jgi:hypothetical protein
MTKVKARRNSRKLITQPSKSVATDMGLGWFYQISFFLLGKGGYPRSLMVVNSIQMNSKAWS